MELKYYAITKGYEFDEITQQMILLAEAIANEQPCYDLKKAIELNYGSEDVFQFLKRLM